MKKNYPVQNAQAEPLYISVANLEAVNEAASEYDAIFHSQASRYMSYDNLAPGISGRPGLTRSDYSKFRPDERVPTKIKEILKYSQEIYKKVGLIRNIIDLMGDFTIQGIRISHSDPRIQKFYRAWFDKISGVERSERFANNLYRSGNVVIRRQTANISLKQRAQLFRSSAKPDIKYEDIPIKKAEIPWRYIYLNPATIDVVGDNLSSFVDKKQYVLTVPQNFRSQITGNIVDEDRELLKSIPREMLTAIRSGKPYLLPKDKTLVFHYKKDDWEAWATPMTYAILDDIIVLEKLKLADIAALDGAISNIRIFKLGSLQTTPALMPSKAMAAKLKSVLSSHVAAGTIDLVWGPDIELIESKTEVYKFLGKEKYEPTLNNIFGGLGIPQTLTGSTGAGGTTNNFISLKTLIERLQYGRNILVDFWKKEIEIVQKAMGFAEPAYIEFDYMNMGDEAAERALYVQLWDRNLMSDELIKHKFGSNVSLEEARINREDGERTAKTRPPKSGQFFESQPEEQLKRIALQKGYVKPEQVGLTLKDVVQNVKDFTKPKLTTKPTSKTGIPGRPKNAKDTVQRKQKAFRPKTKASINLWASEAQTKIADILNPVILESFNKKNMRSLTVAESEAAEKVKFGVLFTLEPFSELNEKYIVEALNNSARLPAEVYSSYKETKVSSIADLNRQLTLDELRSIQTYLYSEVYSDSED